MAAVGHLIHNFNEIFVPFMRKVTRQVTTAPRSEGHGGRYLPNYRGSLYEIYRYKDL